MPCRSRGYKDAKPEPHSSAEIPPRTLGAFALHAKVRLRSGCEQAKTPRGGVFVKRYPKDRKRKERATPRRSATISAGRKRRVVAFARAFFGGSEPPPYDCLREQVLPSVCHPERSDSEVELCACAKRAVGAGSCEAYRMAIG